jgi:hypothetical protein
MAKNRGAFRHSFYFALDNLPLARVPLHSLPSAVASRERRDVTPHSGNQTNVAHQSRSFYARWTRRLVTHLISSQSGCAMASIESLFARLTQNSF